MFLIFDTETTGLPRNWNAPLTDLDNWPRCVQIAWQLHDEVGNLIEAKDYLIQPEGYDIPFDAEKIHGISTELATQQGAVLSDVLSDFNRVLAKATFVAGQNLGFDLKIMGAEFLRKQVANKLQEIPVLDTCTEVTANLCQLPGGRGGKFKLPTLTELHQHLFAVPFGEAHNATADVEATTRCFFELIRSEVFTKEELKVEIDFFNRFKEKNASTILPIGLTHVNLKKASAKLKKTTISIPKIDENEARERLKDVSFVHLHNHSQFTVLQSTMNVKTLIGQAKKHKMPAIALSDVGNMMAAFHFEKGVSSHNKEEKEKLKKAEEDNENYTPHFITPILGVELYVCRNRNDKTQKDNGYPIVFLAKNKKGYQNLIKMTSIAHTEGMYYVPRIDKEIVEKYKEDLIVLTGSLNGEVPNLILNVGENQAEEALLWWKNQFNDDLYIEICRHNQEAEDRVNDVLLRFADKHQIKTVAANNTYYANQEDSNTHDLMLCIRDGEQQSTEIGRGRGKRFGMENNEYYFKSADEMKELFLDIPEAIENIQEIVAKIEPYPLAREILLPAFEIPTEFVDAEDQKDGGKRGENAYLKHLTFEGAKKRYGEITQEIKDRLDFELETIANTGYPGYFLIVQDFCHAARDMGVAVGPGRGSAAGSAVAYCIQITNVDPIAYDLLFERFLNPDRVSMPDIDIDFDDEGRGKVIDWVIQKYGANQVAQIITYGTMAAKSSIKDASRVLDLPIAEANTLAKLIPDNLSLDLIFNGPEEKLQKKIKNDSEAQSKIDELRAINSGSDLRAKVIQQARKIEGSLRNTGIHACGVIITPDDITNFVPVSLAKDNGMICTQFDNSVAESAGLLKMDFLGLKTLTLIKDACKNIKKRHNIDLDPDTFPVDDEKTYELFQKGETVGVFQYESPGMQKYMRELKPTVFADLIAMNALYRPGPIAYIPEFIKRKNGESEIVYDLDACEENLSETYGITVYQEQVMRLSQKLANFTKGEADVLRKAMGKKQKEVLDKMKPDFIERGQLNGHASEPLEKIWKDWEAFAEYAFNKSHSTCYAWVAYQTAYLKANYPAEYMAAVLSNNLDNITQVSFFMEECRRMGIEVLGPDVNESEHEFTVNKSGAVRFGLGGIKGVGSGPVENIILEREENGTFTSIFDMTKRLNLRLVNKKSMEAIAYAGGFDSFQNNAHRAQYFSDDGSGRTSIESALKYGNSFQASKDQAQNNLFGDDMEVSMPEPVLPKANEWTLFQQLKFEKEVIGIFLSAHPLDDYEFEIQAFCKGELADIMQLEDDALSRELTIPAMITEVATPSDKNGNPYGIVTLEDYNNTHRLFIFSDNFMRNRHMLMSDIFVAVKGKIQTSKYPDKITKKYKMEFQISQIQLLNELSMNQLAEMTVKIPLQLLDGMLVNQLEKIFHSSEGNCGLRFLIKDDETGAEVKMPSKRMRINPTRSLRKEIENLELEVSIDKV